MFRSSPGVEQLSAELQKKSRQIDMLDSTINKLNTDIVAFKTQVGDLRKVRDASSIFINECASIPDLSPQPYFIDHFTHFQY
jgi:prefoldin subunit 5